MIYRNLIDIIHYINYYFYINYYYTYMLFWILYYIILYITLYLLLRLCFDHNTTTLHLRESYIFIFIINRIKIPRFPVHHTMRCIVQSQRPHKLLPHAVTGWIRSSHICRTQVTFYDNIITSLTHLFFVTDSHVF